MNTMIMPEVLVVIRSGVINLRTGNLSPEGFSSIQRTAQALKRNSTFSTKSFLVLSSSTTGSKQSAELLVRELDLAQPTPTVLLNSLESSSACNAFSNLSLLQLEFGFGLMLVCGGQLPLGMARMFTKPESRRNLKQINSGEGVIILHRTREVELISESTFLQQTEEV